MKTHWGPWNFHSKEGAIASYIEYQKSVRALVPPDQLLEFSVKDGWEPLCKFLGVPVPQNPFPHKNEKADQDRNALYLEVLGAIITLTLLALTAIGFYLTSQMLDKI